MKKQTTYQLTKNVKMGTKNLVLLIGEFMSTEKRHTIMDAYTSIDDGSLATLASVAVNASVADAYHVLRDSFGMPSIPALDSARDTLPFEATFATYDPDNADGFVDVKHPKESMRANVAVRVVRHYYKRSNRGMLRYVGLTFELATFGKLETHTVRCDKNGHVSAREMGLITMWRLTEKALADDAHKAASAVQSIEKKRTTVTYRLAPIATGAATGIA